MTIKASEILEPLPLSRLLFELCDMASAVTFEREDDGGLIVAVKNGPKGTYALRMTKRQVDDHDHTWLRVLAGYLHQQVLLDHAKGHPRQTQGPRAGSDPRRHAKAMEKDRLPCERSDRLACFTLADLRKMLSESLVVAVPRDRDFLRDVANEIAKREKEEDQGPRAGSDPRRAPAAGPGRPDRTRTKTQSRRKKT